MKAIDLPVAFTLVCSHRAAVIHIRQANFSVFKDEARMKKTLSHRMLSTFIVQNQTTPPINAAMFSTD
ncbi:hypothetical protein Q644_19500 [Brucella intermedia 229E]|uniref:Uncharacterized protein n=1 Tax=Brucella intermedia 229E TaxID=1337887 RepID=U4VA19_9HYPH|nr:hypothetical protein Q644_19500 [Brucella intermedia 229E]